MTSKQFEVRQKILHEHNKNQSLSHNDIAKTLKIAKSTVTNVLKNFNNRLSIERKKGSGRKCGAVSKQKEKSVVTIFKRNPNLSVRDVAKKVKMSPSYVQKAKKRNKLKTFKVSVAPNRDDHQNKIAKTRARKLYETMLLNFQCILMDDETYVKSDFKQLPGQEYFTATNPNVVPEQFKVKKLSKFPKKFLIWQAICTCGRRSKIFVTTGTINQEIYVNECLNKRLMPMIRDHSGSLLFWPDLASAHYSKKTMEWYRENEVNFVPRDKNPPNCPELRPIEKYWANLKRKLKKSKKVCNNHKDFQIKCRQAAALMNSEHVQTLMKSVKRKVRLFAYGKN